MAAPRLPPFLLSNSFLAWLLPIALLLVIHALPRALEAENNGRSWIRKQKKKKEEGQQRRRRRALAWCTQAELSASLKICYLWWLGFPLRKTQPRAREQGEWEGVQNGNSTPPSQPFFFVTYAKQLYISRLQFSAERIFFIIYYHHYWIVRYIQLSLSASDYTASTQRIETWTIHHQPASYTASPRFFFSFLNLHLGYLALHGS